MKEDSTFLGQIFFWFCPEFWVLMDEVDGNLDCCTLGMVTSFLDFNSLLGKTCNTAMGKLHVKQLCCFQVIPISVYDCTVDFSSVS